MNACLMKKKSACYTFYKVARMELNAWFNEQKSAIDKSENGATNQQANKLPNKAILYYITPFKFCFFLFYMNSVLQDFQSMTQYIDLSIHKTITILVVEGSNPYVMVVIKMDP